MKHTFLQTTAQPLDDLALCRWIGQAAPGDILEYHRGFLAIDTISMVLAAAERKALRRLARRAVWAAEERFVHLVQRRVGPGAFSYLAIKRPRGYASPPLLEREAEQISDLHSGTARAFAA